MSNDFGVEVSVENPDTGGCLCISESLTCDYLILYLKKIHSNLNNF